MYEYKVIEILRVVDGDTIDARISLGFGLCANFRFRVRDVDTAEVYGKNASEEGQEAKAFVEQWFETHRNDTLIVRTFKSSHATVGIGDGAFGRWLGSFFALGENGRVYDLAVELIMEGSDKGWIK